MLDQRSDVLKWTGRKRVRVKLLLVLGGLIAGLLIAEVALRIIGYSYPIFYTTDRHLALVLRPGVEGWYRKENETYVRINSDGLRDREHSKVKPANTLRIAVIGDSYAEALQVPLERAFWAVMEQRLQECEAFAGKRVEAINFGVSGYGTAQELLTLRRRVWDYSPDIVLLAFFSGNDISDNSRALKKTDIPYFVYREGRLVLDDSFQDSPHFRFRRSALNEFGRWIRDKLRVIQVVHEAHYGFKAYLAARKAQKDQERSGQAPAGPPQGEELGTDILIYREPADSVWQEAWRITEGLIVLMRDEVRERGAKFLVVNLSNGIQVHPDASGRQAFMKRLGINDLFYPERRIKDLGEREGIAVLNLAPALQSYAEQNRVFLHGFGSDIGNGHWNELGHRVAGEMIARKVCEGMAR